MIHITIPLDKLGAPAVARALSELCLALGEGIISEHPSTQKGASVSSADQVPLSVTGSNATDLYGVGISHDLVNALSAVSGKSAERLSQPRRRARARQPKQLSYDEFVAALPKRSQRFIELIRVQGELTRSEAIKALGLNTGKALGGIVGALHRWSRERGVSLPFETTSAFDGERMWRWSKRADLKPRTHEGFELVHRSLSERSQQFLSLLRTRGRLTVSEAKKELGISTGKGVGGLVGAIAKSARNKGLTSLPYSKMRTQDGESGWEWGVPTALGDSRGSASTRSRAARLVIPTADTVPNPTQVGAPKDATPTVEAPESAGEAEVAQAPTSPAEQAQGGLPEAVQQLVNRLDGQPREFLEQLCEHGTLNADQLVTRLGLVGPEVLASLTKPISQAAISLGVPMPYRLTIGDDGGRAWIWTAEGSRRPAGRGAPIEARAARNSGVFVRRRPAQDAPE